ncbi:unnamed protein product, partial [Bubo scandiacus]
YVKSLLFLVSTYAEELVLRLLTQNPKGIQICTHIQVIWVLFPLYKLLNPLLSLCLTCRPRTPMLIKTSCNCWYHDDTTQLSVIGELNEGALNPTVHVAEKDVKQHWSQYQLLRIITHHCSALGHQVIDCNSFSATIQPISYPLSGPSIKS